MPAPSISIATYNVLDLFDPDPTDADGAAHIEAKLAYLTKKLDQADADVIGLQEIGSESALASLASRLSSSSSKGAYSTVVGTPDARGIRNAVLTRFPIIASEVLTTGELPFPVFVEGDAAPFGPRLPLRRGIVAAELDAHGERLHVLVVHFKSGRAAWRQNAAGEGIEPTSSFEAMEGSVRSLVFRAAEALFVRKAVDGIFGCGTAAGEGGPLVAVIGDFNDVYSSIAFRTVRGIPPTVLDDATRSVPYEKRHSLMHYGATRAIDHVLVSPTLLARIQSARVLNEDLRDHDALREAGETHFYDSDHAPVVVTFAPPATRTVPGAEPEREPSR